MIEDYQELNIEYAEMEYGELTSIKYNLKLGNVTPPIRNEMNYPIVSLFEEEIKPYARA